MVIRFDNNDEKPIKKPKKSKNQKFSQFSKLAKSKTSLKSENLPNFSTKKDGSSFLISGTKNVFNCL